VIDLYAAGESTTVPPSDSIIDSYSLQKYLSTVEGWTVTETEIHFNTLGYYIPGTLKLSDGFISNGRESMKHFRKPNN